MPLSVLAGNRRIKEQLQPRLAGGTLGHAMILSGAEGSGRHALAAVLAQALVCQAERGCPCGQCADCKKAVAGIHPDIVTVGPLEPGKDITVDQVRQLRADAYIRPNEARRKVYVVEQAEQLNDNAQNALLKLLEDGPPYAAFLLLTRSSGALLTTVRSRCEEFELMPVSAPEGQDAAEQQAARFADLWLSGDEAELMYQCALLDKRTRQEVCTLLEGIHRQMCSRLMTWPERRRVLQGVQLCDELLQDAERNVGAGHLLGRFCAEIL